MADFILSSFLKLKNLQNLLSLLFLILHLLSHAILYNLYFFKDTYVADIFTYHPLNKKCHNKQIPHKFTSLPHP